MSSENLRIRDFSHHCQPCMVTKLASQVGLQCEKHEVTTEDGYVITLFRIIPEEPSLIRIRAKRKVPF